MRKSRKSKRFSNRMEQIKNLELKIIPNKNLSAFQKESEDLINEMRGQAQEFLVAETREKKLKICSKIEGRLRRIYNLSKSYGCEEVGSYYEDLEYRVSELKNALKKPRFWKTEKNMLITDLVMEDEPA